MAPLVPLTGQSASAELVERFPLTTGHEAKASSNACRSQKSRSLISQATLTVEGHGARPQR